MAELIWVLVATFEGSVDPPSFFALDSYVQQHDLPAKRLEANAANRVLVVPMGLLCDSSNEVQCKAEERQYFDPTDAILVALSSALTLPDLATLVSKIGQFDSAPTLVIALSDPVEAVKMTPTESVGTLTLRSSRDTYSFALYPQMPQKPGLHMSPERMRKIPEDKNYLQDRETWFQDRYKKTE